jgi:predicted Zn-ribbon and HTH transcriptional regulator
MRGKKKDKGPPVPHERHETVRREIMTLLERGPSSARELSTEVRISEKEVYEHLEHIRRTLNKNDRELVIIPAECAKCGFVFTKRERLRKPGRCPVCKAESIREPLFSLNL